MSFRPIFIAVVVGGSLIVAAFVINSLRPKIELQQPAAAFVRATGKCAECHRRETSAVVHQFEGSRHVQVGVTCLDCHQAVDGQETLAHRGFTIAKALTAANCRQCHATEYRQYLRSRHAAPAWAAVRGPADFTAEQIAFGEQFHPGAIQRSPHPLVAMEGPAAVTKGCSMCHDVGKPNADGSIGTCTACHARHSASVELARMPETCGQCHVGPDHSQIEIYHESKHGVIFNAQRGHFNLQADPRKLTTADMPVPTCATCHMSGLEGMNMTHDTTERLSYYLFATISERRPNWRMGEINMKQICLKCHTEPPIDRFYAEASRVIDSTNGLVGEATAVMDGLRHDGLLTADALDEPIKYRYFDLWHYYGRTAKHGAFMGGADFVQWHGYYEIVARLAEIKRSAAELRERHAHSPHDPAKPEPAKTVPMKVENPGVHPSPAPEKDR
ncbi:MAG: multiheme c-type cytochrome [Thermoguttaceae bacterium]